MWGWRLRDDRHISEEGGKRDGRREGERWEEGRGEMG